MAHSPAERGSSDFYYHREWRPHKWLDNLGKEEVILTDQKEIDEYTLAYDSETERKGYG